MLPSRSYISHISTYNLENIINKQTYRTPACTLSYTFKMSLQDVPYNIAF